MADIYNRLMASRYADAARRFFGEDLELSTVAPELGLNLDLSQPDELDRLPLGIHYGSWRFAIGAGAAGTQAFVGCRNPVSSAQIAAVNFQLGGGAANFIVMLKPAIDATGVTATQPLFPSDSRDGNWSRTAPIIAINGADNVIAGNGPVIRFDIEAGHSAMLPSTFVLSPGFEVRVYITTLVTGFEATVFARWRSGRPEELAF